ncbi:hypothetical protein HMPREF1583_00279 [Gardnerella vaginalis JCP8151B]|nr:hypothetical protein HMPREF1583_00279 [Gardnerella vaginalis JCP8151B]
MGFILDYFLYLTISNYYNYNNYKLTPIILRLMPIFNAYKLATLA